MKTIIIFLLIFVSIISGCATLRSFLQDKGDDIAPTPDKQLWTAAKKANWLVTLSILGIAAGVFALVNGATKIGTAAIASASVSLFMSLAVARFALWMAIFGLIGSVAAALFSILVRRKALVEIIKGVQNFKAGERVGVDESSLILLNNRLRKQSKTTKKIVNNMKNELKLQGQI